jgi:hypothetical protein
MIEVENPATPDTSLNVSSLARYICRYIPLQGRYILSRGISREGAKIF